MDQIISPSITTIRQKQAVKTQSTPSSKVRDIGFFEIAFGFSTLLLGAVVLYGTFATLA